MGVDSATAAIHQYWSSCKPLTDLIPADRVYTGAPPLADETGATIVFPYVSLTCDGETDSHRYSSGRREYRELVKLSVWDKSYDNARAIEKRIQDWLCRLALTFDGGQILDCRPDTRAETQDTNTLVWQIARTFRVLTILEPQRILA